MEDEGAGWLIRLTEAVERAGGRVSAALKVGHAMSGLAFLQELAKEGIFVRYDEPGTRGEDGKGDL
jgi:hypothetical protein